MMIKYTIMVPVYNKIECLKKYFLAIINQNFPDYEIIVVDDGSNDRTGEIAIEFVEKCPETFRYIKKT